MFVGRVVSRRLKNKLREGMALVYVSAFASCSQTSLLEMSLEW